MLIIIQNCMDDFGQVIKKKLFLRHNSENVKNGKKENSTS